MNVKIIIATHKKYRMPSDDMYIPVHVGAEGKLDSEGKSLSLGYVKDNTGENISSKNPYYCELTGLYWAWKNLKADYIGLAHYRRHFSNGSKSKDLFENVIKYKDIESDLGKIKIFVPKKRHYYIESLYSHYAHTHYAEQLDCTREIINRLYPDYVSNYDSVIKRTCGYMFNMMIMEKSLFNNYCEWLFKILDELERTYKPPQMSDFQNRFYGRISEIIFNVWLDNQIENGIVKGNEVKELPCIHMEKINWFNKGTSFLKAKFIGKKYGSSF